MGDQAAELVRRGQEALRVGDWAAARSAFESAVEVEETAEALDGLGLALYWQRDYPAATDYRERAYAAFRERGDDRSAAGIACWLAYLHGSVYGNFAVWNGWLGRARSLVERVGECPERGWVELIVALFTEEHEEKERHVAEGMAIAKRFGDTDLEFSALSFMGWCLVERGQIEEGMGRLDEAVAAATAGEVKDLGAAGDIYCKMLLACELAQDVRRAEEWMTVAEAFVRRANGLPLSVIYCRTYYCGILTAAGRWAEAESELEKSMRSYEPAYRALRSGATVRLADLRIRQGRVEEAAQLLAGHEGDPYAIQPIARLHLARGEVKLAAAVLRRYLARYGEGILQAQVLALLAEAEIAAGHLDDARAICERLRATATQSRAPFVRALAAFCAGMVPDGSGSDDQTEHLELALDGFAAAGLRFEEARARLELARTLSETNAEVAIAEARTAFERFDELSAARHADEAASLLRKLGASGRSRPRGAGTLSTRESEVLELLAEGLSNERIADRLYISRRTAEHHVSNILTKLGLSSRSEAAAYAVRRGSTRPSAL
jgi:DNA-binding NarL/FixJ family response regulator